MKLRSPWLIRAIAACLALVVGCWVRTLRTRVVSLDGRQHPVDPTREQTFYAFWHEGLLALLTKPGQVKVLISQHSDGELIAQVCWWLGYGTLRGSTTRGGCAALQTLTQQSNTKSHLCITPDGPKGPRRKLQMGLVWVASTTGMPIVLIGVGFGRAWRAGSWDRFAIPVPGSTICGVLSEPIVVPPDLDRAGLERWRLHIEERLHHVTGLAEAWAERTQRDGQAAPPLIDQPAVGLLRNAA